MCASVERGKAEGEGERMKGAYHKRYLPWKVWSAVSVTGIGFRIVIGTPASS